MTFIDEEGGRNEEGVYISPGLTEMMEWLDRCLDLLEAGDENLIPSDPWFKSKLTDEQVDALIDDIDKDVSRELERYPGYHNRRSGATLPPEFSRLGPSARRALAEGCEQILMRHEHE